MGEVRKLQKKLRQIENLEIKPFLSQEERDKILRKAELRSRLAELQLQLSAPQQDQGIAGDEKEKMKRPVSDASFPHTPPTKLHKEVSYKCQKQEDGCQTSTTSAQPDTSEREKDTKINSLRASWEGVKFRLRSLDGHNDIITCVTVVDSLVISGSRDTTVKVWHVPTATELRNLGGHSGGVTCLYAPDPEYCRKLAQCVSLSGKERFVLSGSVDCSVRIWALSTGGCVKSLYTFNGVSALSFVSEGEGYIITGSDGGKVEVWSWSTMENYQSIKVHDDMVTSLQSQGPLLFSGSAEGGLSVWEVHCSRPAPLELLHHWSSSVTGCDSQNGAVNGQLALSARGELVFLANGKATLKILNWRTGSLSRLSNHNSVTGMTDCVSQTSGILIVSCFDLASGESMLNLYSMPQCEYLVTLTCQEFPRILCFASWLTASGCHRWVTGGRVLTVWEQLPTNCSYRGDVTAKRNMHLEVSALESDQHTEESEDDIEENSFSQDAVENSSKPDSSWIRCVLQ